MEEDKIDYVIDSIEYTDTSNFYGTTITQVTIPCSSRKIRYVTFKDVNLELEKKIDSVKGVEVYPNYNIGISNNLHPLGLPSYIQFNGVVPIENNDVETIIIDRAKGTEQKTYYKRCKCTVESYTAVYKSYIHG